VNPAIDASVEVIRGEEGEGEYARALQSAIEVLQLAQKTDSKSRIILAEETVGSVWLDLGQYPTALVHSENALKTSKSIHQNVAYETLYCVTSLWRLGRYDEAEEMLVSISADDKGRADIAAGIASNQAQILLSQGQFRKALTVAQKALQTLPEVTAATNADLKGVVARSYAELDQGKEASQEADQLLTLARREANKDRAADEGKKVDEGMVASAELVEAEVALHAHLAAKAMPMAQAALQYFKEKDIKQSEWMSLLSMAEAAKESGDEGTAEKSAKEAIDILRNLEQNWGSPVFRQYSSRPDIQVDLKKLSTLKG
jgi:tetratricopeptide (TPR) repeat protein